LQDRAQLILAEVAARKAARERVAVTVAAIAGELFDKQLALWMDPAREKAALCTRRAGKTECWTRIATITALERPRGLVRLWAINRLRCKQLIWEPLMYLLARHQIAHEANETELTVRLFNGAEIRLLGADKDKEAQKKRGDKTDMEVVIESQLFGPYLYSLVNDVVNPCLFDNRGTLYLEGTPGVVCGGFWFDVTGNENTASRWQSPGRLHADGTLVGAGWSCHHWSLLDNPHLPNAHEDLTELKRRRNWADDHPTYVREYLGRWVNDYNALYYAFDPVRNTFEEGKIQPWGKGWTHTLGWDLGGVDDMALVVWGFHPDHDKLYEAFSWKRSFSGSELSAMDEVMKQIGDLGSRGFNITTMYADTGGGGRMYVDEVIKRYPYSFQPAKKSEKYEHVLLLNDELRSGHAKLRLGSSYAAEMTELPKKQPWPDPDDPQAPPQEDPRFANHCCDAGLYAFRGAMHYLHRDPPKKVAPNTSEWFRQQEAAMIQKIVDRKASADERDWLEKSVGSDHEDFLELE